MDKKATVYVGKLLKQEDGSMECVGKRLVRRQQKNQETEGVS